MFLLNGVDARLLACAGVISTLGVIFSSYNIGKSAGEGVILSPYSVKPGERFLIIDSAYSEKANQTYVKIMVGNTYRVLNIPGKLFEDPRYIYVELEGMLPRTPTFKYENEGFENS